MTRGSDDHPLSQALASVFVGRKSELGELCAGLEHATACRGSVFLVAGEPGIGKSELADRLAGEAVARGAVVLWGRCWEGEGAPPYWPWAQIMRAYLHDRDGTEPAATLGTAPTPSRSRTGWFWDTGRQG